MNIEGTLKKIFEKVKKPVTFFDCETTGLEISKDDIIQIYIATYDKNGLSEMNEYFNTDRLIAPGAQEKHGISKSDIEDKPYFKERSAEVFKFFKGDSVICGYNHVRFDIPILIENLFPIIISRDL